MTYVDTRRFLHICGWIGLCVALAWSLLLLVPATAHADTIIYVNVATGSDAIGSGTSAAPFKSISHAMWAAAAGDTLRVAVGEYSAASGEVFPIWVPTGVRIQGCGAAFQTRVSGDGTQPVFRIHNGNEDTVLDGLTITDGGGTTGGGLYITGGLSPGWGPTIQRCVFSNNIVTGRGGGIAIDRAGAPLCSPTLHHDYFLANDAGSGGGIYAYRAEPDILGTMFAANDATASRGGAIYALECTGGKIDKCVFSGNRAIEGGAIRLADCGSIEVWDSFLFMNSAPYGGGIYNSGSLSVWTQNCVFTHNLANYGGAAYNPSGNAAFNACTFADNEAATLCGGIRQVAGTVAVGDSIMWGNGGDDIEGTVGVSYSTVQEAAIGGIGVIHDDPRFLDLDDLNLLLDSTSPCIDTGNPSSVTGHDIDGIGRPQDGNGDDVSRVDMGAYEFWLDVRRSSGDTRYSTATNMWGERMPFSHHAVIATGLNFPDALCASGLAGVYGCPILLTKTNSLPTEVVAALEAHEVYEVIVVGGPDVVSPAVVTQLETLGVDVTRLYGDTRYETSSAVAEHIADTIPPGLCLIARGDLFPDALALAPIAWNRQAPVLLVKPTSVPTATQATLTDNAYHEAAIAGDTGAVSTSVEGIIASHVGAANVTRLGGTTRYETAAEIAAYAISEGWLNADFFGLATGENFPDALAGGAVCGSEAGSLLLTKGDSLRSTARTVMLSNRDRLREIYLFGGSDVLDDQIMTDCAQLMP